MPLTLNTAVLIAAGRMNADGSDIRFTTAAAGGFPALVPYYIDSGINTSSTRIWVKMPSVANGANNLYMYYGSTGAAAASSMADTFVMASNFNGANGIAPSSATWTATENAVPVVGSTRTIQANQLRLYFGSPLGDHFFGLRSANQYSASAGRRYHAEVNARTGNDSWSSVTLCPTFNTYSYNQDDWLRVAVKHSASGPTYSIERSDYGTKAVLATGSLAAGMHSVDFLVTASSFSVLVDGAQVYTASNNLAFSSSYIYLEAETSNSALDEFLFDNVYVSAYAAAEPAYGSAGTEQGRRYASGNFTSQVKDTGAQGTKQLSFAWAESLPAGTTVAAEVRAHDTDVALATFTAVANGAAPAASGRYAQYRLSFASTDPRYTAGVSSTTLGYVSPPSTPTAVSGQALSGTSIKWQWTDASAGQYQEQGFNLRDSSAALKGSVSAGTTYWIETALNPNTLYTRYVSGFNTAGEGASAAGSKYTLPTEPNVSCDKATGTWVSATLTCTNLAGFGNNGVNYYKYDWSKSPTYTAWDTANTWSSGVLYLVVPEKDSGNYYLHVRSFNADGKQAAADADYGPYWYDKDKPAITTFSPASSAWTNSGFPVAVSLTDTGESRLSRVRYRWTTSSEQPSTGWQAWDSSIINASSATVSYTIGTAGQWYLHLEVEDVAGNSIWKVSGPGTYKIDTTVPSGSITINGGDSTTPGKAVTLSLTYSDSESGVKEVSYKNSGGSWSAAELPQGTSSWTLTDDDGSKTVWYRITDNAGNLTTTLYDTITLDSRTSLRAAAVTALASGTMGETAEPFSVNATLTATPTGAAIPGKNLYFYFGSTNTATTNVLGTASTAFGAPTSSGTYTYNASFLTDGVYSASSGTGTITITQRPTALITEDVNTLSGSEFTAKATLTDPYSEKLIKGVPVSFYFEGSTKTVITNEVGAATVTFTAPGAVSFYDYNATYAGNATYAQKTATSRVGVGLRVTSLVVPGVAAVAQSTFTAQATLLDSTTPVAGSSVEFYFSGSTQTSFTDALGVATAAFAAPLSSGTYGFSAAFAGNGTYAASGNGAALTVNVRPLTLAGDIVQGYVNATYQARAVLSDGITGARVAGKPVTFRFEGAEGTTATDENGAASYVFNTGPLVRTTSCYYVFPGDSGYSAADSTSAVSVVRRPVSLAASDVAALINSTFTAIAELDDIAFAPAALAGKTVTFDYGGEFKSAVTDALGIASVTYQAASSSGAYQFYASVEQDGAYLAVSDTATLTLTMRPAVLSAYPRYVYALDSIQAVADLKDGVSGVYIGSQTVTFNYSGSVKVSSTSASGATPGRAFAVYPATGVAGVYSYFVDFAGNSDFSAGSSTASITVMERSAALSAFPVAAIWGSTFTASAEFRDGATSAVLVGKTVALVFGTTTYYRVTNSSGMASADFSAPQSTGSFNWSASFAGDPTYASASSTGTVTVNKRAPTLTAQLGSKYALDSVFLGATLYDNTVPVASRQISFYLLGATKTAVTSDGLATAGAFAAISTPGVYGYTASFAGDSSYSGVTSSSTLVISARPSRININALSPISGSTFTLTASLLDSNWNAGIGSKKVTFTFQNVNIGTATTSAAGAASVVYTAPAAPGAYTYSASFDGSTQYAATSSSETVTVTVRPTVLEMADYSPPAASTFTASAVLKDYATGAKLQSMPLAFLFLGSTKTVSTDALGSGATSYVALNSTMSYPISVRFDGNATYSAASITKTVYPGRRNTLVLTSDMLSAVALNGFAVTAKLTDYDYGYNIAGATITFAFSGSSTFTVTGITNSTGTATANFTAPRSTGSYTYTATFPGTSLYNSNANTSAVKVLRRPVALEPADLTSVPALSTFTASAVLRDFYADVTISTKTLKFVYVSTKTAVTNAIGVASNTFVSPSSTGTYTYKVVFPENDALYESATAYATIGVVLKPTVLEVLDVPDAVVGMSFTGTAKLKDIEQGNALVLSTKPVTIIFGTTTVQSVTAVGVATAAFAAPVTTGTYSYTAYFNGDSIYGASNSSGTITVNRRPVLFSLATNPSQPYAYRANAAQSSFTITATLSDGQVAGLNLQSKTIRFIFRGAQQTAVTNSLGLASVTYASPVSSGTYPYYAYFDGDESYNPNNPEDSIKSLTVVPRPTYISPWGGDGDLLGGAWIATFHTYTPQAYINDGLSNTGVQGLTAAFVIQGSTITGVTDSVGLVGSSSTFQWLRYSGIYPAVVRFDGNATYAPSILNGGTDMGQPSQGKVQIDLTPARIALNDVINVYPDQDVVITGTAYDYWGRAWARDYLKGKQFWYKVSSTPCTLPNCSAARTWGAPSYGNINNVFEATATVHTPTAAGDYPIEVYFDQDSSFYQWRLTENQRVLRVDRRLTYIIPSAEPYYFGAQMPIELTLKLADLTEGMAGINGKDLKIVLVTTQTLVTGSGGLAGTVKAAFSGLSVGTYPYTATFADSDTAYAGYTSSGSVVVSKNNTLTTANDVVNVPAGNNFNASASVSVVIGTYSVAGPGKTVYFVFSTTDSGTIELSAVTNSAGVATVSFGSPFVPGTYGYTASVLEDENNMGSSDLTNSVGVVKRRTAVAAQNASAYIFENFVSTAVLTDTDLSAAPVSGKSLVFRLHGDSEASAGAVTDTDGTGTAQFLSPNAAGTYEYSATFLGDALYAVSSDTKTVTVSRRVTMIDAVDITTPTNNTFTLTGALADVTFNLGVSTPVAGAQLKFVFNGTTLYGTTGADGKASAVFTTPAIANAYPYTVSYDGSQTYAPAANTRTVTVRKRLTTVSGSDVLAPAGAAFNAQALLIDEFGQKLNGYTINFVFTGTGTAGGSSVTDENGLAAVSFTSPLEIGNYNYSASFAGDGTYESFTDATNNVVVNVSSSTLATPDKTVTVNEVYVASATLLGKSSGAGIPSRNVSFTYNGVLLGQAVTSLAGLAVYPFTPASTGTYRLDVKFDGDTSFYSTTSSATITVLRRSAGLVLRNAVAEVSSMYVATATLRDVSPGAGPSAWLAGRNVNFTFEGGDPQTALTNALGIATVTYTAPASAGSYRVDAVFPGDATYELVSASSTVSVAKHETQLVAAPGAVSALDLFGATATLKMNGTALVGKDIKFTYKSLDLIGTTDGSGQAFAQFSAGASSGPWQLSVNFDGNLDMAYNSSSASSTITVARRNCVVVPEDVNMSVFDSFTATATFRDVATSSTPAGKVARIGFSWVVISGTSTIATSASDGSGKVYVSTGAPVSSGTYRAEAFFPGDATYAPSTVSTATVTVTRRPTQLALADAATMIGRVFTATATLTNNSVLLASRPVRFTFEGLPFTKLTNASGVATATFTVTLATGAVQIDAVFDGDTSYFNSNAASATVTAAMRPTVTTPLAASVVAGKVFMATATLSDVDSLKVEGKTVSFVFNGETKTAVTNSLGVATAPFTAAVATGTYSVPVTFDGDFKYSASSTTLSVTVLRRPTTLTPLGSVNVPALDVFYATATLKDLDGVNVADKPVRYVFQGSEFPRVTDAQGVSVSTYSAPASSGAYHVLAYFDGDAGYSPSSADITVTVLQRPVSMALAPVSVRALDQFVSTASLADVYAPANKVAARTVSFTYSWGAGNSGLTDSVGVATVAYAATAAAGAYQLTASFAGDATYASTSAVAALAVTKRNAYLHGYDASARVFDVFLSSGLFYDSATALPVSGRTLMFVLYGSTLTGTTDGTGSASVNFTAGASSGTYPVYTKFEGDATYNAAAVFVSSVTLARRNSALAVAAPASVVINSSFTASVSMKDSVNAALVPSTSLDVWFQGSTFTALTDTFGVARATYTASLSSGSYKVQASFSGDASYNPSVASATVTALRYPALLTAPTITVTINEVLTATATLYDYKGSSVAAKPLLFTFNGAPFNTVTDAYGTAYSTFSTLISSGLYQLPVTFAGDVLYGTAAITIPVTVNPRTAALVPAPVVTSAFDVFTATAVLSDAKLHVPLPGQSVLFEFMDGISTFTRTGLTIAGVAVSTFSAPAGAGAYQYRATYAGSGAYYPVSAYGSVTVLARPAKLVLSNTTAVIDEVFLTSATLLDVATLQPVLTKTVLFTFGSDQTAVTGPGGVASVSFTAPSSSGAFRLDAAFAGDTSYAAATATSTLTVLRRPVGLAAPDIAGIIDQVFKATVTVTDALNLSGVAAGRVDFIFSGSTFNAVTDSAGIAVSSFSAPSVSDIYYAGINFLGDARYLPASTTAQMVAERRPAEVVPEPVLARASQVFTATASLRDVLAPGTPVAGRTLKFTFSGKDFISVTGADGVAVSTFMAPASSGPARIDISFAGDLRYTADSSSETVTVLRRLSMITLEPVSVRALDVVTATATLSDKVQPGVYAPGRAIAFTFRSQSLDRVTDAGGIAVSTFSGLVSSGSYLVEAAFAGDDVYDSAYASGTVTVLQRPVGLAAAGGLAYPFEQFTATASLTDLAAAAPVAGLAVGFTLDGVSTSALTNAAGISTAAFTPPAAFGGYRLNAAFAGDATYAAAPSSATVSVQKRPTALAALDNGAPALDVFTATATLSDVRFSLPVAGKAVYFTFEGAVSTVTADAYGVAVATFAAPVSSGTYYYQAGFGGDDVYGVSVTTGAVAVVTRATKMLTKDANASSGEPFKVSASLVDLAFGYGTPGYFVPGSKVTFDFMDSAYTRLDSTEAYTNAVGLATAAFSGPSTPGVFYYTARFTGDATYSASASTSMVKVGLLTSLVAFNVKTHALESFNVDAKLTDYLSATLDDKLVTFKFLGNITSGLTSAAGESGVASSAFTAPASSGTYYYTAEFAGDSIYSASNATATVTVERRSSVIIIIPVTTPAYSTFTATVLLEDKDSSNIIGGRNMELYFNGSTSAVTTDAGTGVASADFFAPYSSGTFYFGASFAGDDTYSDKVTTGAVKVELRHTNMFTDSLTDITANSTFTARVQLKDNSNQPIKDLDVDFEFGGDFGSAATDADGIAEAVFTAPASSGVYTYNAVFYGNQRYADSHVAGTVTVGPRATLTYAPAVSAKLGSPLLITGRLLDVALQAGIAGKALNFQFAGATLTAATDELGYSSVTFSAPASTGAYDYTAWYEGDGNTYNGSGSSAAVTIAVNLTQLSARSGITIKIYEPLSVEAVLKDSIGLNMGAQPLLFTFGLATAAAVTDQFGIAAASFSTLGLVSTGTYNYSAEYAGDTQYVASADTFNVVSVQARDTLVSARDAVSVPAKAFTAEARLLDNVNGSALFGAGVAGRAVYFEFAGSSVSTGTAYTNAAGVSTVTFMAPLSTGAYQLTARFADGDPVYAGAFSSATVKVLLDDGSGAVKTVVQVAPAAVYLSKPFISSATLSASEVALPGRTVVFEYFNGVSSYTSAAVTNEVGLATVPFTAPASSGTYYVTVSFAGADNYAATRGTGTVSVSLYPDTLVAEDVSAFADKDFTARAVLSDGLSLAAVAGRQVTFTFFNGLTTATLSAVTSSTGSAEVSFSPPAVPGNYSYTAVFAGDTSYVPAYDKGSVLIAARGSSTFLRGYEVLVGTGEVVAASATLTTSGYALPARAVAIAFGGVVRVSTTDVNGNAAAYFTAPASSGTYAYSLSFTGDSLYNTATATGTVNVVFRKAAEAPVTSAVVAESTVTLSWTPVTVPAANVTGYVVEKSAALRTGWSDQGYVASTAATLGYSCQVDTNTATFLKVKTILSDGQESGTSLVIEVPAKTAEAAKPNYYYMSQDESAWVKLPGAVMDKLSAGTSFALDVEKKAAAGFLLSYNVTASGSQTVINDNIKAGDRKGVKLSISYSQLGSVGASAVSGQMALYWFNGVEWVKIGGELDVLSGEIYTYSRTLGQFAVKASALASEFTLTKVAPRIFSPETASASVNRARFYFENPGMGEVTIRIFDVTGAIVRRNLESEGANVMFWNGKDQAGAPVKGGVYIYQIEAADKVLTGTVVVAK